MNEQTFTFPSSSGNGTYTAIIASDGKLLCNCKGWTVKRLNQPRHCKHTKEIAKDQAILERGEFVYLAGAPDAPTKVMPTHRTRVGTGAPSDPAPFPVPSPMLASPMTEAITEGAFDRHFATGWALEEKLDGHRIVVRVRRDRAYRGDETSVEAFARPQRGQAAKPRTMPPGMVDALATLGEGDYDGELVAPSGKSWDVVVKGAQLVFVAFDILTANGASVMHETYDNRRALLLMRLALLPPTQQSVSTVLSLQPSWAEVQAIWARGGEGAILKRLTGRYQPGYRSPDWLKVKPELHAELVIIGYEKGKSGPYSALRLRDNIGTETTVKTLGNQLLRDITRSPDAFLGRRVVIEYQERTPSGEYRHGRFDHFAKETR